MPNFEEIRVPDAQRAGKPINIAYADGNHVRLQIGAGAEVDVVETCKKAGTEQVKSLLEIELGERAILRHVRICSDQALAQLDVRQQSASQYQLRVVSCRSKTARNDVNVKMQGEGASCDLGGVSVSRDHDRIENQIEILHQAPRTKSDQKFHQIAFDHGYAGIDSLTRVNKNVPHVVAHQSLRCLLMSPHASVHAKPQLEIGNDDIQCSHGATVGTLDEDQIFYLRSRGISASDAEAMLLDAFIDEILAPIQDAGLRKRIREQC